MSKYRGWEIVRPDHNSAWWTAKRGTGRVNDHGQEIPEVLNAGSKKSLLRMIDRRMP